MAPTRFVQLALLPGLFIGGLFFVGCAAAAPSGSPAVKGTPGARSASPSTAPEKSVARKTRPAYPEHPPELGVRTAMKGEPSDAALAEARLVPSSCAKAQAEDNDALLKEMRAAVDASFKEWHDEQPSCWESMREEYRWRQQELEGSGGYASYGVGAAVVASTHGYGAASGGGVGSVARAAPAAKEPQRARSASGTNVQVAGVDEADIVKTDGRFVYFAANGALRIAEALNPRVVSVTKLPGTARDLFVEGNRAVVYTSTAGAVRACTYAYDCAFGGDGTQTTISIVDITDRSAPKLTRTIALTGSLIASRRIGNAVHTVVADGDSPKPPYETWPPDLEMCGTVESIVRAKFAKMKADNERAIRARTMTSFPQMTSNGVTVSLCDSLLRTPIRDGKAFTTVVSFDLTDDKTPPRSATLQSRPGAVFAAGDALYLSVAHHKEAGGGRLYSYYSPSVDEVSEIHKFRIGSTPKETRYVGSGTVPGHVLNQFAMDQWYGYLRVATTKGRVPDPRVESAISILAESEHGNLVRVGAVEKIAPGEDIRAVRFDDDRGYVVTFKKTDPLFVLDLFQPSRPRVLGELKIPGFSTYLHRIDPKHLLSIGFDANDHGDFAFFDGVILQLFDVDNPTDPKLVHKEKIGSRGSTSEAATNHLAFNYFAEEGLLAIPMTICEGGGDGMHGALSFSGLLVYDVDIERGFTRLGGVDHGKKGVDCNTWWSNASSAVKRSVFLDDLVYSIASDRAKVQRIGKFGVDVADLSLNP